MSNKKASFWHYDGNHPDGRDCERRDPHGFGLDVISYAAYAADGGDTSLPLDLQNQIQVRHKKGDDFGHEVEISAPAEVWAAMRQWLEKDQARYYA